jgi:hypothetical protein
VHEVILGYKERMVRLVSLVNKAKKVQLVLRGQLVRKVPWVKQAQKESRVYKE